MGSDTVTASSPTARVNAALATQGWNRTDTTNYYRTNTQFTHTATAATITFTGDSTGDISAYLFCDDVATPDGKRQRFWKVDCVRPDAASLIAAADTMLNLTEASARPLAHILEQAQWLAEHEYERDRVLEVRFTGPDDTEACQLLSGDEPEGWLITRPRPDGRTAIYLPSSEAPHAVLAALTLTPATTG